jgi:hypothetical protein
MNSAPLTDDPPFPPFEADFGDDYPDATEEVDQNLPEPFGEELQSSVFFDADHAHDLKTRRSITGLIVFVGSTPIHWLSKRQGAVASSTYAAEFLAMRTATEESMSLRYMLRCLGIPVRSPTRLFGDNLGVIQNASIPDSDLKKKHVSISYHTVRESVAAGIIAPYKLSTKDNFADILTKQLPRADFRRHVLGLLN